MRACSIGPAGPENYDEIYQRALATGYTVGQEGDSPRGRFVYFRNEGHPGTVIEMAHATPRACACSTRSAPRRAAGTAATRSAANGRAEAGLPASPGHAYFAGRETGAGRRLGTV